MHPLRIIFIICLAIAAAVTTAFGYMLHRLHVSDISVLLISTCVFGAILIPWAASFVWALRRASDLEELTVRTRRVARGSYDFEIAGRQYHGELDDLARLNEELRAIIIRQRESSHEYRNAIQRIVDSMGEGLMAINHKRQIVFANSRVAEIFGFPTGVTNRSFIDVVRKGSVISAFDRALAGEESAERAAVGERQYEVRAFPVTSSEEIAGVALFIDVTEIERLQRVRKDFLDDFSHEVRTPLAGIRSAAESFEKTLTREQEDQLRAVMLRQVARMERLIKDLSELNHIESGEIVLQRRDIDLLAVAEDLAEEFRDRHAGTGVNFAVAGDHVHAFADPARVQQMLSNLIDNAIKYGAQRGTITMEVSAAGRDAVLRVSDEGSGIPDGELGRIFNRFYRADRSRSQNVPGIGLGLAIVKHLVAAHGGRVRAFNRDAGSGATFEIHLPRAEELASRAG